MPYSFGQSHVYMVLPRKFNEKERCLMSKAEKFIFTGGIVSFSYACFLAFVATTKPPTLSVGRYAVRSAVVTQDADLCVTTTKGVSLCTDVRNVKTRISDTDGTYVQLDQSTPVSPFGQAGSLIILVQSLELKHRWDAAIDVTIKEHYAPRDVLPKLPSW